MTDGIVNAASFASPSAPNESLAPGSIAAQGSFRTADRRTLDEGRRILDEAPPLRRECTVAPQSGVEPERTQLDAD
jgi:hypothetical protein